MRRRQHSQEIQTIQTMVKRVSSVIKLPKLNPRPNSLSNVSPNHTKRTTSSPSQSNRTINWKQRLLLAKKLVPLQSLDQNEQQSKNQPISSLLLNKLIPVSIKESQIQDRILSSKLFCTNKTKIYGMKNSTSARNVNFYNVYENVQTQQNENINQQKIQNVKQNFKLLLSQEAHNELLFPNFSQININKFFPFWEMTDTILFTYKKIIKKSYVVKEIVASYSNLSTQLNKIRKQIYSDIEKLAKPELNQTIFKAFIIEIQFIYMILAQIIWKEAIGVFELFLRNKMQLILKVRKQILRIYLCDFTTKQEIKVNKRIVGFISFKEKYVNELKKNIESFQNDFKTLFLQFNDPKFAIFDSRIQSFQEILFFQQKLKHKILDFPISPYLKSQNLDEKKYNLIIQPQDFLFKQNKQNSTFLLRQGSLDFIKSMSQNCNIVFFSKLSYKILHQYISYLEQNLRLKFNFVLDKKFMTYKNLKLQKNLLDLGIQNIHQRTIVIDPNYKQFIAKQFWKICFPIDKEDSNWQNSSFIKKLSEKLIHKLNQREKLSNKNQ